VSEKEVTRAELEGKLWEELNRVSFTEKWVDAARLLHESISAREAAATSPKNTGIRSGRTVGP